MTKSRSSQALIQEKIAIQAEKSALDEHETQLRGQRAALKQQETSNVKALQDKLDAEIKACQLRAKQAILQEENCIKMAESKLEQEATHCATERALLKQKEARNDIELQKELLTELQNKLSGQGTAKDLDTSHEILNMINFKDDSIEAQIMHAELARYACRAGNQPLVKALLAKSPHAFIDSNSLKRDNQSVEVEGDALHVTLQSDHKDILRLLLDRICFNKEQKIDLLTKAILLNSLECVKLLVEQLGSPKYFYDKKSDSKIIYAFDTLSLAIEKGFNEIAVFLVEQYVKNKIRFGRQSCIYGLSSAETPLCIAAQLNNLTLVKALLEMDPHIADHLLNKDPKGMTAIDFTTDNNIKLLMQAKAADMKHRKSEQVKWSNIERMFCEIKESAIRQNQDIEVDFNKAGDSLNMHITLKPYQS
jgi:ankyrin repeat protein